MSLDAVMLRLAELAPPPERPVAAEGDFSSAVADLGSPLPADFRSLVCRYGYGTFGDHVHLWSPFFAPCTMMERSRATLEADRMLARMHPKAVPFALFPEAAGALPWADTDNGDVAYWLTDRGAPDRWLVAIWNPRSGREPALFESASDWLASWLEASESRWFDPFRERRLVTIPLVEVVASPYARRLDLLREALGPVVPRGAYGDEESEKRQVHFLASDGAWKITYDTVYGHALRLAAPPEELAAAEASVDRALHAMGCARAEKRA
jgi:hypothetical protein